MCRCTRGLVVLRAATRVTALAGERPGRARAVFLEPLAVGFGLRGGEQRLDQLVLSHAVPAANASLLGHLGQIFVGVGLESCWRHQWTYLRVGPARRFS